MIIFATFLSPHCLLFLLTLAFPTMLMLMLMLTFHYLFFTLLHFLGMGLVIMLALVWLLLHFLDKY